MEHKFRLEGIESLTSKLDSISVSILEQPLLKVGIAVENQAKINLTNNGSVDTGRLRNSIQHQLTSDKKAVEVGTNVEYAPYLENGVGGNHVPGGRQGWWIYIKNNDFDSSNYDSYVYATLDEAKEMKAYIISKYGYPPEDVVITDGFDPKPFLLPAVTEHLTELQQVFETSLLEEIKNA